MIVHTLKMCISILSFLYIQTLNYDCSHTEDVLFLFCAYLINTFTFFTVVELRHFSPEMHWECLVCVICNFNSFQSFKIFNLCIMIVLTLKMCTSYFVYSS